jgi:hypothetical protein
MVPGADLNVVTKKKIIAGNELWPSILKRVTVLIELFPPTKMDLRLSAKLVPTFADRGCHVVSVTGPYSHILGFLHRSRYFFFHVAPQVYSRD